MESNSYESEGFRERRPRERTRSTSGKENAPILQSRGRQSRRERKSECEMIECDLVEEHRLRDRSESPLDFCPDSALPSDSDHNWGDHHSSEEELEVINSQPVNEFRPVRLETRSAGPMRSRDQQGRRGSGHRTSPPEDAHRPFRSQSPPNKLFHTDAVQNGTSDYGVGLTPKDVVNVAGNQRKRRGLRPQFPQRPCLDFEKMQELKARSMTAWQHDGELTLFCW